MSRHILLSILIFIAGIFCFFLGSVSSFAQTPTPNASQTACEFTKGDQNPKALPFKSQRLLNIFEEVSQKTGVPAALLAAVARVESTTASYSISTYTDDEVAQMENPTTVLENIDTKVTGTQKALCPRSPTGALGLMQIQPSKAVLDSLKLTNESDRSKFDYGAHDSSAVNNGAKFIGKNDGNLTITDYCNPKVEVYIAAGFILKKMSNLTFGDGNKWDPSWNTKEDAFNAAAKSYYGCLKYPSCESGPNSYGDDIWTSFKSCGTTLTAGNPVTTSSTTTTTTTKSSSGGMASNEVITRVGTPPACATSTGGSGKIVVINPGHAFGLTDPTAVGGTVNGKDIETEKNVAVAQALQKKLETKGYKAYLVHNGEGFDKTNRYNDYQQRVDKANSYNPDLYVEIHFQTDNAGPFSIYSDRKIISTDGEHTQPNPHIVTPNVDQWLTNSRKAATSITKALADALNKKYGTSYSGTKELTDYGDVGRSKGGHLYTIGPEGTVANPTEGDKSKILRENKAVSAYIETLGLGNKEQGEDIDLLASAYAQGIDTYFGSGSTTNACTAGSPPGDRVFYCQGNPAWNGAGSCLGTAGCGPSSMAMLLSSFGITMTPPQVAGVFSQHGWYTCNGSVMNGGALASGWLKDLGFTVAPICENCQKNLDLTEMKKYADKGYLFIASSKTWPCANCKGDLKTVDHIVMLEGVDPSTGTVSVRDPNNCDYKTGIEFGTGRTKQAADIDWLYVYAIKKIN